MSESGTNESGASGPGSSHVLRWIVAIIAVLCIVALLAWDRGQPGVGGRFPDPEDASAVTAPSGIGVQ